MTIFDWCGRSFAVLSQYLCANTFNLYLNIDTNTSTLKVFKIEIQIIFKYFFLLYYQYL